MPGHDWPTQSTPSTPLPSMGVPLVGSTTTGRTPNMGSDADPGFIGWQPGRLVIMCPPVSVCQKVSTMTHRPRPTSSK